MSIDEPRISEDDEGFRQVWFEYRGETFAMREIDGLAQETIADMELNETGAGYALIAASMVEPETSFPYFESIAIGMEKLRRRPLGLLNVLGRAAALANRMTETPIPES